MVDRFGTKNVQYAKADEGHYTVTASVEISDLFYGWLLGFGRKMKLVWPENEVEKFKAYVERI